MVETALRARADQVLQFLAARYGGAECSLAHQSPLELLVSTILSAQCTDERVNLVTPELFRKFPTAADLANAPQEALEEAIKSTGFYRNKAKSIQACCAALVEKHAGAVPQTLEHLVGLAGVGRKTANVVLGTAFGIPSGVVVDTHVGRISHRLGLTRQTDPVKIERDLMALLPEREWISFSHRVIYFGRDICQARKPKCEQCGLSAICPKVGVQASSAPTGSPKKVTKRLASPPSQAGKSPPIKAAKKPSPPAAGPKQGSSKGAVAQRASVPASAARKAPAAKAVKASPKRSRPDDESGPTDSSAAAAALQALLQNVTPAQHAALQKTWAQIPTLVPNAVQGVSYGLPAWLWQGKPLAAIGAGKNHCAFYPMSGKIVALLAEDLKGFETSKGAIRFQPQKPLSVALLKKLLQARMAEITAAQPKTVRKSKNAAKAPAAPTVLKPAVLKPV